MLRVVVDPQAELPDIVLQYLGHLRQSDQGVRVLRRVPGPALPEVGDYEVIPPGPETGGEHAGVREHRETGIALIGVPYARNNVLAAFNWAEHEGFDPDAAKARQLDAEAARSLNADVCATDNVFLLNRRNAHSALAILDAMAVIGLHQRARGRVVLDGSLDGLVTTWQAEMMQSRVLLPGTSALFAEDTRTPGKGAVRLVGAATQRLGKALSARDKLLLSSLQRHRSFGVDAPEDSIERVVVALQGMFDSLARAVNACLPDPQPAHYVSFGSKSFRRQIPPETRLVIADAQFTALRAVISALRNTVHHEPVGAAADDVNGRVERLVTLPRSVAEPFNLAVEQLGRRERWIAHDFEPYGLALRPTVLAQDLIEAAASIANRIIETVPRDRGALTERPGERAGWLDDPLLLKVNSLLYGI